MKRIEVFQEVSEGFKGSQMSFPGLQGGSEKCEGISGRFQEILESYVGSQMGFTVDSRGFQGVSGRFFYNVSKGLKRLHSDAKMSFLGYIQEESEVF